MPAMGARTARRGQSCLLLAAALACAWWSFPSSLSVVPPPIVSVAGTPEVEKDSLMAGLVKGHAHKLACLAYVLCFMVAKTQPEAPKEAAAGPLEGRKDVSKVMNLNIFLSLVSGIVNAVAIIQMGGTVAHHTGNASHAGRLAGVDGLRFFVLMVAYFGGAGVAGFCKCDGEAIYAGRKCPALMSGALAVMAGAIIYALSGNALVALPLLSFSQGLQNTVSRRCSSVPLCTTHMTGYLTDAGSGLGGWARTGGAVPLRTKFFIYSILAFIAGGYVAKKLLDLFGILTASFVPAAAMAATAYGLIGKKAKA